MTVAELENKLEEDGFTLINDTVLALGYGTRTFERTEENGIDITRISITCCKNDDKYLP